MAIKQALHQLAVVVAMLIVLAESLSPTRSLDKAHTASVTRYRPHQVEFQIPAEQLDGTAFRLRTTSESASSLETPVLVSLQHRESVATWTLGPLATVARTLCPPESFGRRLESSSDNQVDWELTVEVLTLSLTTQSVAPVRVEYLGELLPNFTLTIGSTLEFVVESPASPQLFALRLASASSRMARLAFEATPASRCAVVQLHRPACPLLETGRGIISSQTLKGSGNLLANIDRAVVINDTDDWSLMYLTVRTLTENSKECGLDGYTYAGEGGGVRQNISLSVEPLSAHSASLPVALAAGFFVLLLLLAPVCAHICWQPQGPERRKKSSPQTNYEMGPIDVVDSASSQSLNSGNHRCSCQPLPEGVESIEDVVSDTVDAADQRRQTHYCVHAVVAAVFFCLPALQLVLASQHLLDESGNQDICYYNFACLLPVTLLGRTIYASNSVFSNLGYAILGVAFLACVVVHRRSMKLRRFRWRQSNCGGPDGAQKCGVPHSHGLHFASGLCMCVEGLLSAGYHLCPSSDSFQFDTAFMLVLAALLALLVLAKRRPGLRPPAHWGCLAIAVLLLLNTLGSSRSEPAIRAGVFAVTGLLLLLPPVVATIRLARLRRCVSIAEVVYGCLWLAESASAFAAAYFVGRDRRGPLLNTSYSMLLLACLLVNTLCYLAYYLAMKLLSLARTRRCPLHRTGGATVAAATASAFCLSTALACWCLALWQFSMAPTDWKLSPAESRSARNRPCVALGFFDAHDLWHFASSLAIFFSFLFLLTLDDDVASVPRQRLEVF